MSWQEIDKLLQKLFDVDRKKQSESAKEEEQDLADPTEAFRAWLDEHLCEEEYTKKRMICIYCQQRIEDDRYVVMCHPDFLDNHLKQIFFHTNKRCNPRVRYLQQRREIWLREYNYRVSKKK